MSNYAPNVQSDFLPWLYIYGLNISAASTTILAIAPGQARDSSDRIDMQYGALAGSLPIIGTGEMHFNGLIPVPGVQSPAAYMMPIFINPAVVGAGGLDSGTLLASTEYAVYLIADSSGINPNSAVLSLTSNAAPLLPYGYDAYRLLGFVLTSSTSTFLNANILNWVNAKGYFLQPPVSVLSGGSATTFTAVALTSAIPTTTDRDVLALLNVTFTPLAVGDVVQLRPSGVAATSNLVTINGIAAGVPQINYVKVFAAVVAGQPTIDYKVSQAGDAVSISVAGYYVTLS